MSISDMLTYAHSCALLLLSVSSICFLRLVFAERLIFLCGFVLVSVILLEKKSRK